MRKEQYQTLIHLLFSNRKTREEIKAKLNAVYGDLSLSMTTVSYWFEEFKRRHTSVFDEECPGRPSDVVTAEIVKKFLDMILADRRTKVPIF